MEIEIDVADTNHWNEPFQLSVGTTNRALTTHTLPNITRGIQLKSDKNNTGKIAIGREDVSISTGYILYPGEDIFIPLDNTSIIHVISDTASQFLYVMTI
jgi:hypothetical protein